MRFHKAVLVQQSTTSNELWLVTFGDLLTLLLCFFLAIITLNAQKIKGLTKSQDEISRGIGLAQPLGREERLWFGFNAGEVTPDRIKDTLKSNLELHPRLKSKAITDVYIEVCNRNDEAPVEWRWHEALAESISVKRQVIDALGLKPTVSVGVRVLGPRCEGMSTQQSEVGIGVRFNSL